MGKKNEGAESATGTTKTTSKAASAPKVKTYEKLSQVFADFEKGEQPRGAKFSIGESDTRLITSTRGGDKRHFTFVGTPAEFAAAVLKSIGIKSEVITGSSTATPADDGE